MAAPVVTHISWGKMEVRHSDDSIHPYKDCKIWPEGSRAWDWNESEPGTRHVPGIQISDVAEFITKVDEIVLSRGVNNVLQVMPETLAFLEKNNIKTHVEQTKAAIEVYNRLASSGTRVAGVFHSTC